MVVVEIWRRYAGDQDGGVCGCEASGDGGAGEDCQTTEVRQRGGREGGYMGGRTTVVRGGGQDYRATGERRGQGSAQDSQMNLQVKPLSGKGLPHTKMTCMCTCTGRHTDHHQPK